jgi:hypothetical protein
MSEPLHPAASVEFLSRLHDRELSPAEAREFEAHRESCASCREAVEEYERSLRAFRASPTAAPASDLSARILRKIREQSPSRRPFGVTFGIDIRWAGVLAAALLVVLIAPALFHREEKRLAPAGSPASPEALPAYLLEEKTATAKKDSGAKVAPEPPASAPANEAPAKEKEDAKPLDAAAERDHGVAQPRAEEKREGYIADKSNALAAAPPSAPAPRTQRQAGAAPGGEAGGTAGVEEQRVSVHLVINAIDGYGEPPEVRETPTDDALAELTGREFILLVETGGRVRDVTPSTSGGNLLRKDAPSRDKLASAKTEGSELLGLRFTPSDRPRRLLVRVE